MDDPVVWVPHQTRLPRKESDQLERLAQRNERSVAAEMRLAVRHWMALQANDIGHASIPGAGSL